MTDKMKSLIYLLLFVAVSHEVSSQFAPVEIISRIGDVSFIRTFSNMIRKNCNQKDTDFSQKMMDMQKCYLDFKGKETFCGMVRNHLVNCTKPVIETLENCVDPRYHDIPKFALDIVNSGADYLCKTKGEKIIELIHPCLTEMALEKEKTCLKSFKQKLDNIEKDTSITNVKTDICKSLENTKSCFLKEFSKSCNNAVTMESAVGLYDAVITRPCKHV